MREPSTNELARLEAQRLAFAPLLFQACRALRDLGLLEALLKARRRGLTVAEAGARCPDLPPYAVAMLLEAGLASGLCRHRDEAAGPRFFITPMGAYWQADALTRVNADFTHHVCYHGAAALREALLEGVPAGLPTIDATGASTVYEALRSLPDEVRRAWFAFDHHHSDGVFDEALAVVFDRPVHTLVDIGANTGRFARRCLQTDPQVQLRLVDLPGQLALAREALADEAARVTTHPTDLLREDPLPAGADVYWMSQFLDCFGEDEVRSILRRVRQALPPTGRVFVLETFWDKQRYEAARLCVIGTSLYFAAIANGRSRMYHSQVLTRLAREAGLTLHAERALGLAHTLLTLGPG